MFIIEAWGEGKNSPRGCGRISLRCVYVLLIKKSTNLYYAYINIIIWLNFKNGFRFFDSMCYRSNPGKTDNLLYKKGWEVPGCYVDGYRCIIIVMVC